jgi:hypothetical protein
MAALKILFAAREQEPNLDEQVRAALKILSAAWEIMFRKGERSALLLAVKHHLEYGEPLPEWAKIAFLEACYSDPKSWDDVFGRPGGDKWRLEEEFAVAAEAAKVQFPGCPQHPRSRTKADSLFRDVATRLGMKPGTVKTRYYSGAREFTDFVLAEVVPGTTEIDHRGLFVLFAKYMIKRNFQNSQKPDEN